MQLISKVEIECFRSVKNARIETLDNFNSFVGLNNSGKSNLLRALNLFFLNTPEVDTPFSFDTDYYLPYLHKKRRKKYIQIGITFKIPSNFLFPKRIKYIKESLGNEFTVVKRWEKNSQNPAYFLNDSAVNEETKENINIFLSLVNFRYIPNRVLPIDMIRKEHQALKDVLIRRLGKDSKESKETFDSIKSISEKLISKFSGRITGLNLGIKNISLSTPQTWADMVYSFGYNLSDGNFEMSDALQGSGTQSLLMLETLYLIDKDFFQQFGWKQASIWAVEEPESSLHTSMEAQVAYFLNKISNDNPNRLQIFSTTHSDLVMQYSDKAYFVKKENGETNFDAALSKKDILSRSSESGISRYSHPILFNPLDILILPDGKYDCPFIEQAISLLDKNVSVKIISLENLKDGKTGGQEDLYTYLSENKEVIKNRTKTAPLIVVLDWESKSKEKFDKLSAQVNSRIKIFRWDEKNVNPLLDDSFRGTERFYSDRLIQIVNEKCPNIIGTKDNGMKTIDRAKYEIIKKNLYEEICANSISKEDIKYAEPFIKEIIEFIKGIQNA